MLHKSGKEMKLKIKSMQWLHVSWTCASIPHINWEIERPNCREAFVRANSWANFPIIETALPEDMTIRINPVWFEPERYFAAFFCGTLSPINFPVFHSSQRKSGCFHFRFLQLLGLHKISTPVLPESGSSCMHIVWLRANFFTDQLSGFKQYKNTLVPACFKLKKTHAAKKFAFSSELQCRWVLLYSKCSIWIPT